MLVIEGVLPFLAPISGARRSGASPQLTDGQIRFFGLTSMLAGLR